MFVPKLLVRGWGKSVLWVILLSSVICFLTVSAGQKHLFGQNITAIDQAFTTVAIVDDTSFWRTNSHLTTIVGREDGYTWVTGIDKNGETPDPQISILETAEKLGMVQFIDDRVSSKAYSTKTFTIVHPLESLEAAIAREEADKFIEEFNDITKWNEVIAKYGPRFDSWAFQEGVSSAIMTAKCISVDFTPAGSLGLFHYHVLFEIDHNHSPMEHPFHKTFKYVKVRISGTFPSYNLPFGEGKDYLLALEDLCPEAYLPCSEEGSRSPMFSEPTWFLKGSLQGNTMDLYLDVPGNKKDVLLIDEEYNSPDYWDKKYPLFTEEIAAALGISYEEYPFQRFYVLDDDYILSFHELRGSVTEFLKSEGGEPWEFVIETARKNIQSLSVIGTNRLQAIAHFNKQVAYLVEGREFSREEYEEGAKVCLISASLARENGLALGQELPLSMQKTGYAPQYDFTGQLYWHSALKFTSADMDFTEEENYHIVGIYTAPEWDYHYNSFTPNTVFIPQRAFPEAIPAASDPPCQERAGMLSIVLQNGSKEAFYNNIAGTELSSYIHVLDQGYDGIASQLWTLWREANSLFIVSFLVWGIVGVFFFLMVSRRLHPDMGIMVSLGVKRARIRRFMLGYIAIIIICGLVLGGGVAGLIFKGMVAKTYGSLEKEITAVGLPFTLSEATLGLPVTYALLQGTILVIVASVIALMSRLNVRVLLKRGLKV